MKKKTRRNQNATKKISQLCVDINTFFCSYFHPTDLVKSLYINIYIPCFRLNPCCLTSIYPMFLFRCFFCFRIHRSKKNRGNNHQSVGFPYQLRVDLQPTNPISSGSSHPPDDPAETTTSDVTKGGFWRCGCVAFVPFFCWRSAVSG